MDMRAHWFIYYRGNGKSALGNGWIASLAIPVHSMHALLGPEMYLYWPL